MTPEERVRKTEREIYRALCLRDGITETGKRLKLPTYAKAWQWLKRKAGR